MASGSPANRGAKRHQTGPAAEGHRRPGPGARAREGQRERSRLRATREGRTALQDRLGPLARLLELSVRGRRCFQPTRSQTGPGILLGKNLRRLPGRQARPTDGVLPSDKRPGLLHHPGNSRKSPDGRASRRPRRGRRDAEERGHPWSTAAAQRVGQDIEGDDPRRRARTTDGTLEEDEPRDRAVADGVHRRLYDSTVDPERVGVGHGDGARPTRGPHDASR